MLLVMVVMVCVVMLVMVVIQEFCRGCGEQASSEMKLHTTACSVHMQR